MKSLVAALAGKLFPKAVEGAQSRFDVAPVIEFEGDWGQGDPENLELLTTSMMDLVLQHLHPAEIAGLPRIMFVTFDQRGPLAVYRGEPGRSPVAILLSAKDKFWAQYLYQFSHELGHVLCNFRRADLEVNRFQWLEEALCGAMSLYCLEQMARNWPFPAGHKHHGFAKHLWGYLADRRRTYLAESEIGDLRSWYLERAERLVEIKSLAPLNRPLAVWLYDLIRSQPELIASYRYQNLWKDSRAQSLTEQLLRWRRYCMPGRDGLPKRLISELGDVP